MNKNQFAKRAAHIAQRAWELSLRARMAAPPDDPDGATVQARSRDVLGYGAALAARGIEPEKLGEMLSNLVALEPDADERRLKAMQKDAALGIREGLHPKLIMCYVFSHMDGEEAQAALDALSGAEASETYAGACAAAYRETLEKPPAFSEATASTAEAISKEAAAAVKAPPPPFAALRRADPAQLGRLLRQENPVTAAFALAALEPDAAARAFGELEPDMQIDAALLMGTPARHDLKTMRDLLRLERALSNTAAGEGAASVGDFGELVKSRFVALDADETMRAYEQAARLPTGTPEAMAAANRILANLRLDFAGDTIDTGPVIDMMERENPRIAALVLACLEPGAAARILQRLPREMRVDVALRIAGMDGAKAESVWLGQRLATLFGAGKTGEGGGLDCIAGILRLVDGDTRRNIVRDLYKHEARELALEIRHSMFALEDIVSLSDRDLQFVLREVYAAGKKTLATILKGTNPGAVQDKIFGNMSKRAIAMIKEDLEWMAPASREALDDAWGKIAAIAFRLEGCGEIIIFRDGVDKTVA